MALLKDLNELVDKRRKIDSCLLLQTDCEKALSREEVIMRLGSILNALRQSDRGYGLHSQENPSNGELIHKVFEGILNLSLAVARLPLLPKVRHYTIMRPEDKDDVIFFKENTPYEVAEFNVGCEMKHYTCEPGDNNALSAIVIASTLLQQKKSADQRYIKPLQRLSRFGL